MKGRILIITGGPLCRNPRVVKEGDTLAAEGYETTVLHVSNHAPSEAHDVELMRTARFRRVVVDELAPGMPRFRRRLETWAARKLTAALRWQTSRSLGPINGLLRNARTVPADLTIVHNEAAHYVGRQLHAEGQRVAADIEDWHSEDLLPADRRHRPLKLLQSQERSLLRDLTYTTTTSHALANALHARFGGMRPHVIMNAFPLQPDPCTLRRRDNNAAVAFFWFSQRLGPGRGLEPFLAAWAKTKQPSRLVLLGEPSPGFRDDLLDGLPEARRQHVEFRDCVAPKLLPSVIREHDVGLALEDSSIPNRDLTITNKVLQYLNAGLALVATSTAGQREVLARASEAGILVSLTNAGALAKALDTLIADRPTLSRRQQAARRLADQVYCWERESPRLIALVSDALKRRNKS